MQKITVKKASRDDMEWINARYAEIDFKLSNYDHEFIAIAEVNGERAGLGRLVHVDSNNSELGGMFVSPEFRGLGVAAAIVKFLSRERPDGSKLFCLPFAHLESFYASFGFRAVRDGEFVPSEVVEKHQWCNDHYDKRTLLFVLDEALSKVSPAITLRDALPTDAPILRELTVQLGYLNTVEEISERLARINPLRERLLVAVDEQNLAVGYVHLRLAQPFAVPDTVEIVALIVDEKLRSSGIGETLVRAAEEWAKSLGVASVQLRSNVQRQQAHRFYERLGYEATMSFYSFRKNLE